MAKVGASRTFGEQSDQTKLSRHYLLFHAWYGNFASFYSPGPERHCSWIEIWYEKNVGPDLDRNCGSELFAKIISR